MTARPQEKIVDQDMARESAGSQTGCGFSRLNFHWKPIAYEKGRPEPPF